MLLAFTRRYSSKIKAAVKIPNESHSKEKKVTFDKSFPMQKRVKAWERDGMQKDEWFKKKYAHVHARDKARKETTGETDAYHKKRAFYDKIKQQELAKKQQHFLHKAEYTKAHPLQGLKPNPLIDYVFGTNSVISALLAKRREYFVKLHYYGSLNTKIESSCSLSLIHI